MVQTWSPEGYARHASFVSKLGTPLLQRLAPRPGERILDLGCGDGTLTAQIAETGASVVGVDASAEMVAAARTRGVDARVMNATALEFDGEFDAVFSNAVLHWVHNADAALAGVRRALKPGGRFAAEFGGHACVAAIHTAVRAVLVRRGVDATSPWYFPTAAEYEERIAANGLVVDEVRWFTRPTELPTGIEGWLETFAGALLARLPASARSGAVAEIVSLLAPVLSDRRGTWTADYTRIQAFAQKAL